MLQLSPKVPTAQRPGSCWSYLLQCKKTMGTRVLLTATETQKCIVRQLENPHYQARSSEQCKQHSPPQKPTRRRLPQNCCLCPWSCRSAGKAPMGGPSSCHTGGIMEARKAPGSVPASITSKGLLYSPKEAVQHHTHCNPELSSGCTPSGILQVLPFAH